MTEAVAFPSLGFVGLGNMGRPMAANLMAAGYSLTVYDVDAEAGRELLAAGASWAGGASEVAASSDVVFVALPGPAEVEATFVGPHGLLDSATEGSCIVDVSTNSPASIQQLAKQAAIRQVHVLDAPLSGGVRGARKGTLTIMVGGDPAVFERCRPLFEVLGKNVFHMGPIGSGHVTKLVNNFMGITNAIASMEAVAFGVGAGLDPEQLLQVVNLGTGASHMTTSLYEFLILARRFDPVRFSVELAIKDLGLALETAESVGVQSRVGRAAHNALADSLDRDSLAGADISRYITVLEKGIGKEVRAGAPGSSSDAGNKRDRPPKRQCESERGANVKSASRNIENKGV
jgi:2-hydroxymethylglutarate dehydrogenase